MDKHYGHEIIKVRGTPGIPAETDEWVYKDTGESPGLGRRRCGECGLARTEEGHDGCLGTLRSNEHGGIMNACCGHGELGMAYIQYEDGTRVQGEEALERMGKVLERDQSSASGPHVCKQQEVGDAVHGTTP